MKSIKELFEKKIPTKNYYIVLIVSVLVIILTLYVRSFYLNYKESIANTSVFFDKSINQMNTEDLDFALSEISEAIIYVSYTGNEDIYSIERKLFREIDKANLTDKIIYWNVTDLLDNNEYLQLLKTKYPNIKDEITVAPMLIYVKDGEAKEAMSSELKTIDYKVFNKLVEKYEIK